MRLKRSQGRTVAFSFFIELVMFRTSDISDRTVFKAETHGPTLTADNEERHCRPSVSAAVFDGQQVGRQGDLRAVNGYSTK